jgi:histidine triad (HIT) family protein
MTVSPQASPEEHCVFCRMVSGAVTPDIVFDGGDTLFFYDKAPKARVHVVGITKKHLTSLHSMVADDQALIGKLLHDAAHVAESVGISESGYRVSTNVGSDGGQEIQHLHFHILGGERLGALRG